MSDQSLLAIEVIDAMTRAVDMSCGILGVMSAGVKKAEYEDLEGALWAVRQILWDFKREAMPKLETIQMSKTKTPPEGGA